MKAKKERVITLRVTEEEYQILTAISEQAQTQKSDLIRKAVSTYFTVFQRVPGNMGFEHMIFHIDMQKVLFDHADDATLEQVAETSFQIGMREDFIDRALNPAVKDRSNPNNLDHQLKMMATYVFSDRGQRWFDNVTYARKGKTFTFGGQHRLGEGFSKFIVFLIRKFADYYNYKSGEPQIVGATKVFMTLVPK
jgi:hypothetical protein